MPVRRSGRWRMSNESRDIRSAFAVVPGGLPEFQYFAVATQTDHRCSAGWLGSGLFERPAAAVLRVPGPRRHCRSIKH